MQQNKSNKKSRNNNSDQDDRSKRQQEQRGVFIDRRAKKKIALAALVLLAIILMFASLQPFFLPLSNTQKYSELGLLGSDCTVGKYPTSIIQNETFTLCGYLVNQMGTAQYYQVLVKLGNQSTVVSNSTYPNAIPANAPVIAQYYSTLSNNQTYLFPMNLAISQIGRNEQVIFELWSYKISSSGNGSFVYTGIWDRIWLSVAP
jgi:uncharacterized membrane protein